MKTIYKIENKVNGKLYIGQTKNSIEFRYKKHIERVNYENHCSALYLAIKKYGKENFEINEIISGEFTDEELNELEIFFIKHFDTLSPNGYNLQTGGKLFTMTEEVKKRLSDKLKGREITWGKKISETIKKKWEDPKYREQQTKQRFSKRGKYRDGIIKEKLRVKINEVEFEKDYRNGMKIKDLETKYNISTPTIYRIINTNNICRRR